MPCGKKSAYQSQKLFYLLWASQLLFPSVKKCFLATKDTRGLPWLQTLNRNSLLILNKHDICNFQKMPQLAIIMHTELYQGLLWK